MKRTICTMKEARHEGKNKSRNKCKRLNCPQNRKREHSRRVYKSGWEIKDSSPSKQRSKKMRNEGRKRVKRSNNIESENIRVEYIECMECMECECKEYIEEENIIQPPQILLPPFPSHPEQEINIIERTEEDIEWKDEDESTYLEHTWVDKLTESLPNVDQFPLPPTNPLALYSAATDRRNLFSFNHMESGGYARGLPMFHIYTAQGDFPIYTTQPFVLPIPVAYMNKANIQSN